MNKLYIKDMSKEQLTKVINESCGLQNAVSEYIQENENFFVSEIMEEIRDTLSDWRIAPFEYSYIDIKEGEIGEFLKGCENIKRKYVIFTTEENKILDSLLEVDNEDELYNSKYNDKVKRIIDIIIEELKNIYEASYNESYLIEEFLTYAFEDYSEYYIEDDDFTTVKVETIVTLS